MNEIHFGGIRAELVHRPEDRWTSKSCKSPAAVTRRCARLAGGSVPRCRRDGIMVGLFFRSECILLGCNIPQLRIVLQKVLLGLPYVLGGAAPCLVSVSSVWLMWVAGSVCVCALALWVHCVGLQAFDFSGLWRSGVGVPWRVPLRFFSGFAADCRVCRLWGLCLLKNRA